MATTHCFRHGQGGYVITALAECWIVKGVYSYRCKGMHFFFSTCREQKVLFIYLLFNYKVVHPF